MDTTGAPSHDSGSTTFAQVIPIRPGVDVPPRRMRARAAGARRAGGRAAGRLRSPVTGRARRWAVALACATMLGLMWWDSRSEGYSGLPVNTLGQVLGDLIMMGIALPLVLTRRPREDLGECGFSLEELADQISRSTRRVQLLDAGSTLFPEAYGSCDEIGLGRAAARGLRRVGGGRDARAARITLLRALRTALARDVAVEILLPRPDEMIPLDDRTGLPARTIEQDLAKLHRTVPAGKLDIYHYREAPAMAMVRCDDHLWISFPVADADGFADEDTLDPETAADAEAEADAETEAARGGRRRRGRRGSRTGSDAGVGDRVYLRLDAHTRNARALVRHFARLVAADGGRRGQGPPASPDRPARTPAAAAELSADLRPPPGRLLPPRQQGGRRPLTAAPAVRAGTRGAAVSGQPPARREPAPLLIVTAPVGEEFAEIPPAGWLRRPGAGARIPSDRDGE